MAAVLRSVLRKAGLALLVTAVILVFAEGLASVVLCAVAVLTAEPRGEQAGSTVQYDPDLGWSSARDAYLPDMFGRGVYVRTNAQGFRANKDYYSPSVPLGKLRVVCSGDSFTFGYGVNNEQTWCHLLTEVDPRLESVNMGQIGYGIDQAYLWYRRDGLPLEHDVQVFAFITADFHRMATDRFLGYGKPVLELRGSKLHVSNVPVPRSGYRVSWALAQRLEQLRELRLVQALGGLLGRKASRQRSGHKQSRQALRLALEVFDELARINRRKNSTLVLVHLPTVIDHQSETSTYFRDEIRKAANQRGWVFLDLVEQFRKMDPRQSRGLFRPEGHYTLAGNQYVTRLLYPQLAALPAVAEKLGRLEAR